MSEIVDQIIPIVKSKFANDSSGHDWYHIDRVFKMATHLQEMEGGDKEIIQIAALLHDISDHKMNGGILNHGGTVASELLAELNYPSEKIKWVSEIIDAVSFKGALVADQMSSLEGKIVQDADRLDAIGAMGIARAFSYGGNKNRPMYIPHAEHHLHSSFEEYVQSEGHTINHFYEKLLLLKDRLHTNTARKIGENRHDFMVKYLEQFYNEWNTENLINE
jgi:uncharacterized protein